MLRSSYRPSRRSFKRVKYGGLRKRRKRTFKRRPKFTKAAILKAIKSQEHWYVDVPIASAIGVPGYDRSTVFLVPNEFTTVRTSQNKKMILKSLSMKMQYFVSLNSATTANFRYAIVYDRAPDGAIKSVGDIFTAHTNIRAHIKTDVRPKGRYQVLLDRVVHVGTYDATSGSDNAFIDLKNKEWNASLGANGSISDMQKGCMYVLTWCDSLQSDIDLHFHMRTKVQDI